MTAAIAESPPIDVNRNATADRLRLLDRLTRVSDAPTREQGWLWQDRIPEGELTAVVGPRGAAKSYLIAEIVAKVTTGEPWPDELTTRRAPGEVLYISAEDELVEGIKPRLAACGADLARIRHLDARTFKNGDASTQAVLVKDIVALAEALPELKLIVIDPFADALEAQNDRRTDALSAALVELKTLASKRGLAIILVNATDKASTGRMRKQGVDVLPFLQARTRALWCVEQDPALRMRYFWLPLRTNLAYGPLGLKFLVEPWSKKVSWDPEPVDLHPDDFKPRNRPPNAVARAGAWIKAYLEEAGQRRSREVLRDAALAGISRGALYDAKARLGVVSVKETRKKVGCWDWVLPPEGAIDHILDLLEDPKALARLATGDRQPAGEPAGASRGSSTRAPVASQTPNPRVDKRPVAPNDTKMSEDQKVPEDVAGVVVTPRGEGARSPSPAGLRRSTSPTRGEVNGASAMRMGEVGRSEPSVAEDQKVPEDLAGMASTPRGDGAQAPSPDGLRPSTSPTGGEVNGASAMRMGEVGRSEPSVAEDQKVPEDLVGVASAPRGEGQWHPSPAGGRPSTSLTGGKPVNPAVRAVSSR